jgi:ribosome-associated toxin RatA of RatAB toxin-antitoxin module
VSSVKRLCSRRSLLLTAAAIAGSACFAWLVATPAVEASESRELSTQERAELRAGKLVVRPELRSIRGTPMFGGMAWQLVRAPADEVYRALIDVPAYIHYLPAAEEVRLLSAQPPQTLFVQHRLGFVRANYCVRTLRDAARRSLRFRLDRTRPSAIRDAWGELRVTPYGADQSVVSMAILADLGGGLVAGLIRENVHTWMLRVPELIKRHVERAGREERERATRQQSL